MSAETKHCSNCEYQLTRYHNFCPNCGQKVDDELSLRVLFHNTIMNYFSVDARFFRSFIPLLIKPGYLAKEFVRGKRLLYLHPAQFYLFASIVFFFLFSIATRSSQRAFDQSMSKTFSDTPRKTTKKTKTKKDSLTLDLSKNNAKTKEKNQKEVVAIPDSVDNEEATIKFGPNSTFFGHRYNTVVLDSLEVANAPIEDRLKVLGVTENSSFVKRIVGKQVLKFRKNKGVGLLKAFYDTIPISMFFLIPIFAFLLRLLYRKRGRFAHHMVFSFYFFAFMFLASSIILVTNYIVDIPDGIDALLVLSTFIYLLLSLKRFYEQGFWKTFLKSSILCFVYLLFVVPVTGVILWVISFFIY